ncbi:MAG: Ig-like domain-containing protein [Leptospirales bacterium]|nr:Ig-like domain-containing protein [Leptospirales bacterium]
MKRRISSQLVCSLILLCALCECKKDSNGIIPAILTPPAELRPRVTLSSPSVLTPSVPVGMPIFVEFNMPMDSESTRRAFSLSSSTTASGQYRWTFQRLHFDLDSPLVAGSSYVLRVQPSAKSESGYDLETEYIVHFFAGTRQDAPQVLSITPAQNAQAVLPAATIRLVFSRPMDVTSVQSSFSISPAVPGQYAWDPDNSGFTFTPFTNLTLGTTYAISLLTGAKDTEGIPIIEPFNSTFQVGSTFVKPTVTDFRELGSVTPLTTGISGAFKDSRFVTSFSQAMKFLETQNAVTLTRIDDGSSVAGSFQWNGAFTQVTFLPTAALEPLHWYRFEVSTNAQDLSSNGLAQVYVVDFFVDNSLGAINSNYLTTTSASKTLPAPAPQALTVSASVTNNINVVGASGPLGAPAQIQIEFSHSLDPNTIATNVSLTKLLGSHASIGTIQGLAIQNGALTNSRLIVYLDGLGTNEYSLTLSGSRNGIRSATQAGETGTWMSQDATINFKVFP